MDDSNKPIISICIANFNGEDLIGPCLDSVFNQEICAEFEVIVHDDASTDHSVDYIQKNYTKVMLLRSDSNVGFCTSNNRMAAIARGKYLLLLNNDATLRQGALQALLTRAKYIGRSSILGLPQYDMSTGSLVDKGSIFDPFLNPVPITSPDHRDVGMVSGACLWISKELWDEIGGFPEYFFNIAEDTYICFVARLWGYHIEVVDGSGFDHLIGANIGGGKIKSGKLVTTYRRRYYSERNKSYTMILCYPALLLTVIMPFHLILLIMEGMALSFFLKDKTLLRSIYFRAFSSIWINKKQLFHDRLRIQSKRCISFCKFTAVIAYLPHKLRLLLRYGVPKII